jgi:hypothetical protein
MPLSPEDLILRQQIGFRVLFGPDPEAFGEEVLTRFPIPDSARSIHVLTKGL